MSWDIYGNDLRPGHCEVHPWVHEEYPCQTCMAESNRRIDEKRQEREYYAEMEKDYNRSMTLEHEIAKLEDGEIVGLS